MTDHAEEQSMEAEALEAIFENHFTIVEGKSYPNSEWIIELYPEQASDPEELQELNHVAIQLQIQLPATYPDQALPNLSVQIQKGLAPDPHGVELQHMAEEEATNNEGLPSIYAIAERLREWLAEHNRPGLGDTSAYAAMMRKQEQAEREQKKAALKFESQTVQEQFTAAELEELAVRKRRAEGTPCNKENFDLWKEQFDKEMEALKQEKEKEEEDKASSKAKSQQITLMTGYEFFSSKTANLEALEAAAELAQEDEEEPVEAGEDVVVDNEALFDDDVDLEDLDFDDSDEEGDDELDI